MRQLQCPECSYPIEGIICPNCKKQFPIEKIKEVPEKKKKKPVIN
jgi:DNA-directed RNA polymerase subunit RPC12/RpoP